jgi:hypothetical protein
MECSDGNCLICPFRSSSRGHQQLQLAAESLTSLMISSGTVDKLHTCTSSSDAS